jgi:hypothetical protein
MKKFIAILTGVLLIIAMIQPVGNVLSQQFFPAGAPWVLHAIGPTTQVTGNGSHAVVWAFKCYGLTGVIVRLEGSVDVARFGWSNLDTNGDSIVIAVLRDSTSYIRYSGQFPITRLNILSWTPDTLSATADTTVTVKVFLEDK